MGRDRLIILFGVGVLAIVFCYLFSRVLSGDVALRSMDEVLAPEATALSPTRLKPVMREMAEIDKAIEEDTALLTAEDALPIHYRALSLISAAESLKTDVPRDVAKAAHEDWKRMLDEMIGAAETLAKATADPEKAQEPAVNAAHQSLRRSCVRCHNAFGLPDSGVAESQVPGARSGTSRE